MENPEVIVNCADVQADLSFRWSHKSCCRFVMRWLIYYRKKKFIVNQIITMFYSEIPVFNTSSVAPRALNSLPASILYKSTAGRYRPVSYPDGPITARCRFKKIAYWACDYHTSRLIHGTFGNVAANMSVVSLDRHIRSHREFNALCKCSVSH